MCEMDVLTSFKEQFQQSDVFKKTLEKIRKGDSVLWDECAGSSYALIAASILDSLDRPLLVVVSNVADVERAASDIELFSGRTVLTFPVLLSSSIEDISNSVLHVGDSVFGTRLRALKELEKCREGRVKAPVIVASLAALLQPVPSREQISNKTISIQVEQEVDRDNLVRWLIESGFESTTAVELRGEYSVRGYVVDIFANDWENPVRIEFFGDTVESIRSFDVSDQRSIERLDSIQISRIETFGIGEEKFVDWLPKDTIVLFHNAELIIHETSRSALSYNGSVHKGFSVIETMNSLYGFTSVHVTGIASGAEPVNFSICGNFFSIERFQGDWNHVERALNESESSLQFGIICSSEAEIAGLKHTLSGTKPFRENRIAYSIGYLSSGFEWREKGFVFIGSDQLFGHTISRRTRVTAPKKKSCAVVDPFLELSPGDLVVHIDHGIARFMGIHTIQESGRIVERLKLEFADSIYLYVSTSQIGKLQRYIGAGNRAPQLSKLYGKSWAKQKSEVQASVIAFARETAQLQAMRDALSGIAFQPDQDFQLQFEALFPYQETPDQLSAIYDIKKDMERPRPMDRLLCGDVGFGKTEVALRAAFKAIMSGYQVAVLVPTTVLAAQHYHTFSERMAPFPIKVGVLSRYLTKKEQAQIIENLKAGEIDVVIGTQRVVQKDVEFKKLGLVVIDEEQKFGVKDKERLKRFHTQVDVLTMTATPIPRTLHYSLMKIRDVSNLTTPPADRLPVETKVLRFNPKVIREAILRELNRGGQVYFLHNRVRDIEKVADAIREIVPEARIEVAHAQTSSGELEKKMRGFVLKQFDVLVCTTIVESGLDIPNANTIFINNANMFGLAELHQLRGRVGREKKQAYCYLMIGNDVILTRNSLKRLQAIEEYDKLGAGFQIAMKDLEIRGAGNILGVEQSGHIALIGYEMYRDFLEQAIAEQNPNNPEFRVKRRLEVEVDLPISEVLSDSYIPDPKTKIDFYGRFNRVRSFEELIELRDELQDRFGALTQEAVQLFMKTEIRLVADPYHIKSIQTVVIKGSLDGEHFLALSFPKSRKRFQLQEELKEKNISMQLVEEENNICKGYIKLPRKLFDSNGKIKSEAILKFIFGLFKLPNNVGVLCSDSNSNCSLQSFPQKKDDKEQKTLSRIQNTNLLKFMQERSGKGKKPKK